MTRKHYIALAEALRFERPDKASQSEAHRQWRFDVKAIADVLAADNGRFDRERFYRAAGLEA